MAKATKLPSGAWRVRVFMGKGVPPVSVTRDTKAEAEHAAAELRLDREQYSSAPQMTLRDAITKYIESKRNILSPSTIRGYKGIQKNYLQDIMDLKLGKITQDLIQQSVNNDSALHAPKSIRNAHGLLSAVFAEYHPRFVLRTKLPARRKLVPQIPSREETVKIIEAAKGTELELPVLLALWLGLRLSEVRGLKFTDLKGSTLTINAAIVYNENNESVEKQTKTYSSTRTLEVPESIVELINKQPKASEYVVNLSGHAIYMRFIRMCELNGIPHFRFHDLRHANASIMLALGIPDKYAMERMGHATNNMLKNVYQHTMQDEKTKINAMVDGYFKALLEGGEGEQPEKS